MSARIIPFNKDVARRCEELNFARIAGIVVLRRDPAPQVSVRFKSADDVVQQAWLGSLRVSTATGLYDWRTYRVTQIADVDDRTVDLTLGVMGFPNEERVFSRFPLNSILVESNGYKALFSWKERLPLAP